MQRSSLPEDTFAMCMRIHKTSHFWGAEIEKLTETGTQVGAIETAQRLCLNLILQALSFTIFSTCVPVISVSLVVVVATAAASPVIHSNQLKWQNCLPFQNREWNCVVFEIRCDELIRFHDPNAAVVIIR